jgi:hypothetical protein
VSTELIVPQYHPQLPAFLQSPDLFAETDKAIAGIGGGAPPYISIKASKWRLVSADGEEAMVNQLHLDVIVLGGNEHVSKTYYAGAYDPASGNAVPPTCFSDNGVAPSSVSMVPQAPLCASCAFNAWGSKVTPTGSQVKACTDSKKLAVVLASDTPIIVNGAATTAKALDQIYLLRVPAASMRGWRDYAKGIRGHGAPIVGLVTVLTFDPAAAYPLMLFKASKFVDEATFRKSQALLERPGIAEFVGANDVPRTSTALPGPVPQHLTGQLQQPEPAPAPVAAAPVVVAPAPVPVAAAPAPATRPRGRPPAAATAPAPVAAPTPAPTLFAAPAGNGAVIQQPTASSPDLDALLSSVLSSVLNS